MHFPYAMLGSRFILLLYCQVLDQQLCVQLQYYQVLDQQLCVQLLYCHVLDKQLCVQLLYCQVLDQQLCVQLLVVSHPNACYYFLSLTLCAGFFCQSHLCRGLSTDRLLQACISFSSDQRPMISGVILYKYYISERVTVRMFTLWK